MFEVMGPEAEFCDKSDETGARIELGSCAVNAGSTVMPAVILAVTCGMGALTKPEACVTMADNTGCSEVGNSIICEDSDDIAASIPLAAGPEADIWESKLETPGWIELGSAVA